MFKKLSLLTLSVALSVPAFAQEKSACDTGIRKIQCIGGFLAAVGGSQKIEDAGRAKRAIQRAGRESKIEHITKQSTQRLLSEVKPGDRITISYISRQAANDGVVAMGVNVDGSYVNQLIVSKQFENAKEAKAFLTTLKPGEVQAIVRTRTAAQHADILKAIRGKKITGIALASVGVALMGAEMYRVYGEDKVKETEATIQVDSYQNSSSGSLRDAISGRQAQIDRQVDEATNGTANGGTK